MQRDSSGAGHGAPAPVPSLTAALHDAGSVDLDSLRLVLRQHLDDLRRRGVDDGVLRPIEAELRRFEQTVDDLVEHQEPQPRATGRRARPAANG